MSELSQQPYFLRAIYEWCVDNGYTPHILVQADDQAKVPQAYVKDGQIVLNIGPNAVRNLLIDNDWVGFSARFGGVAQDVQVPIGNVLSIYARETGEGMAFAKAEPGDKPDESAVASSEPSPPGPGPVSPKGRSHLRVVK